MMIRSNYYHHRISISKLSILLSCVIFYYQTKGIPSTCTAVYSFIFHPKYHYYFHFLQPHTTTTSRTSSNIHYYLLLNHYFFSQLHHRSNDHNQAPCMNDFNDFSSYTHFLMSNSNNMDYYHHDDNVNKDNQRRNIFKTIIVNSHILSSIIVLNTINYDQAMATTNECSNGSIAAEGAIPGAYQTTCMSLPQRKITLQSTGEEIIIYQGSAGSSITDGNTTNSPSIVTTTTLSASLASSSVAGRTGVAIWNSGLLLSKLLDQLSILHSKSSSSFFEGKTIFELGCGTGIASIVSSKLGAKYVYATDGNQEVINLAKFNLETNGIYPTTTTTNNDIMANDTNVKRNSGEAILLQWGSLDLIDYYDTADVIIGSDLTYNSGSWKVLVDTFASILKSNHNEGSGGGGYVLYLTLGHTGFNVESELNGFLTVVQSSGLLEVVNERSIDWPFPGITSLESLLSSSLTENEKKVLSNTGGFKIVVMKRKESKKKK